MKKLGIFSLASVLTLLLAWNNAVNVSSNSLIDVENIFFLKRNNDTVPELGNIGANDFSQSDYFDWSTRLDRHTKPAGIFAETPFPIDENTITYTIKNDEYPDGRIYYLGTKYYVDGARPDDSGDGQSLASAKKTIAAALTAAPAGNVTILVRGAHDAFDGYYPEVHLTLKSGDDDTHRFLVTGYGQERPIVNGVSTGDSSFRAGTDTTFAALQRFKIQDNYANGLITNGGDDSFINVIDVWFYNNCKWDADKWESSGYTNANWADGNVKLEDTDNTWIFHCTSEHTSGHGIKVSDNSHNGIVEWTVVKEAGYWPEFPTDVFYGSHPSGIDLPSDPSDTASGHIVRYNIVSSSLFYGIYFRGVDDFSCHHNEVYDCEHNDQVDISGRRDTAHAQIYASGANGGSGRIYANIVRDSGEAVNGAGIGLGNFSDGEQVLVLNNLIYNNAKAFYLYGYNESGITLRDIRLYNNSVYGNSLSPLIYAPNYWSANEVRVQNNIVHQAGSGTCANLDSDVIHTHNLYYAPGGSVGVTLGDGEQAADPQWQALPIGEYSSNEGAILPSSLAKDTGVDLDTVFNSSFNSVIRPQGLGWDIGAYEFTPELNLHGTSGNETIYLDWTVDTTLPATSTWMITYESPGTVYLPVTGILSPTRAYTLTDLTNGVWYTVTLHAMLDSTSLLSDTVHVMPTGQFVYLPLVLK